MGPSSTIEGHETAVNIGLVDEPLTEQEQNRLLGIAAANQKAPRVPGARRGFKSARAWQVSGNVD